MITLHVSHTIAVSLYFECIFGVLTGNIVGPKVLKSVSELDGTHKGSSMHGSWYCQVADLSAAWQRDKVKLVPRIPVRWQITS